MPPKRKVVTRKVKEDQNGSVNEDLADIEVREEHSDDIEAKATTPELVDSGNDSEIGGGIISSEEEEDEAAVALKDSDDEEDGALKLPAGTAYDDDVPERPPPNKKHTCLQVCNPLFLVTSVANASVRMSYMEAPYVKLPVSGLYIIKIIKLSCIFSISVRNSHLETDLRRRRLLRRQAGRPAHPEGEAALRRALPPPRHLRPRHPGAAGQGEGEGRRLRLQHLPEALQEQSLKLWRKVW